MTITYEKFCHQLNNWVGEAVQMKLAAEHQLGKELKLGNTTMGDLLMYTDWLFEMPELTDTDKKWLYRAYCQMQTKKPWTDTQTIEGIKQPPPGKGKRIVKKNGRLMVKHGKESACYTMNLTQDAL